MSENNIQMQPVTSSQIAEIGFDENTGTLSIRFKTGSVYHYANVSRATYDEFVSAESLGRYFGENIKNDPGRYPYTKVA